jgi:hypothetical protein
MGFAFNDSFNILLQQRDFALHIEEIEETPRRKSLESLASGGISVNLSGF